jgi:hypothetical protein
MDVFSAAVTLAFAGQGRTIWQSNSEIQLMRSINEDEPDLSGLTELQRNFLLPLLNKDISERPTSEAAYEMSLQLIANYGHNDGAQGFSEWVGRSKIKKKKKRGVLFYVGNSIVTFLLLTGLFFTGLDVSSFFDSSGTKSSEKMSPATPDLDSSSPPPIEPTVSKKPMLLPKTTPTPIVAKKLTPKPVASSTGSFKESPAESTNVVIQNLFGRSFEDGGGLDWWVPLTNSNSEEVPPITNLQFRLIGNPNKTWLDIGYKLKSIDLGVLAIVDKVALKMFIQGPLCPEFRFVRIENELVVNVWKSGTPDCATDYIP